MQKLDEHVLSNAAAVTAFAGSLLYYLIYVISPSTFAFFLRAKFVGADVAGVLPEAYSFVEFLQGGIALAIVAWVLAVIFARVYNSMQKSRGRSRR